MSSSSGPAAAQSSAASASFPSSSSSSSLGGLELLDRDSFRVRVPCAAVRVPCKRCGDVVKALQGAVLRVPKTRPVVPDPEAPSTMRFILLEPHVTLPGPPPARSGSSGSSAAADTSTNSLLLQGLTDAQAAALRPLLDDGTATVVSHASYEKTYAMLTASEVFRRLIPEAKEWPASFETAGHVAHVNLRAEMVPYKRLIGQVLLDKNRNLRTVVNKTSHIATEFRTFPMEVIAGKDDTVVEVREGGARFRFDFREVYWNSRLQYEHARVVQGFAKGEVVCDMMAGIGPFAIPAAMKGCVVHANDLNPQSYACLVANGKLNKGCGSRLHASNRCGRDFVRRLAAEKTRFDHVVMNLPATAIEFLDVFRGLLLGSGGGGGGGGTGTGTGTGSTGGEASWWEGDMPSVHCYCFSTAEDRKDDVLQRVAKVLGLGDDTGPLLRGNASVHEVRDVAPHKWMMCAEFRIPQSVMFDNNSNDGNGKDRSVDGPAAKRQRTDNGKGDVSAGGK